MVASKCLSGQTLVVQHAGVLSARTTHFQRTIATLQGVLTGLYPNAADDGISIPAITAGDGNEIMYGNARACARLGQLNSSRLKVLKGRVAGLGHFCPVTGSGGLPRT